MSVYLGVSEYAAGSIGSRSSSSGGRYSTWRRRRMRRRMRRRKRRRVYGKQKKLV